MHNPKKYEQNKDAGVFYISKLFDIEINYFKNSTLLKNEKENIFNLAENIGHFFDLTKENVNEIYERCFAISELKKEPYTFDAENFNNYEGTACDYMGIYKILLFHMNEMASFSQFISRLIDDLFSDYIQDLEKRLEVPMQIIYNDANKESRHYIDRTANFQKANMLPAFVFYQNEKDKDEMNESRFYSKKVVSRFLEEDIKSGIQKMTFFQSPTDITRLVMMQKVAKVKNVFHSYANNQIDVLDNGNASFVFNSLGYLGFGELFKKKMHYNSVSYTCINEDVSNKISNKIIDRILLFFTELGLSGNMETITDKRNVEIPIFNNLIITVSKHAVWDTKHNQLLIDALNKLEIPNELISFDENGIPTIKL